MWVKARSGEVVNLSQVLRIVTEQVTTKYYAQAYLAAGGGTAFIGPSFASEAECDAFVQKIVRSFDPVS